jgi:hypothetical protein
MEGLLMRSVENSSTEPTSEKRSLTAFDSLRTAMERPQSAVTETRKVDKPGDTAIALRLAGEAIATAAKSAETELRKLRELVDQSDARIRAAEDRARAAEERARQAEKQRAEVEKILGGIRDHILGNYPEQRAA